MWPDSSAGISASSASCWLYLQGGAASYVGFVALLVVALVLRRRTAPKRELYVRLACAPSQQVCEAGPPFNWPVVLLVLVLLFLLLVRTQRAWALAGGHHAWRWHF